MRVAKLLSTSVTAAALAFSMLASTIPASAAPGFHAAYFSESSFLTLAPGQQGQFAAGFSNTGDQAWTKGSATAQASLKTRNGSTALYNAGWGPTWFNATTYANQANDLTAPGQVGFFIYNVTVPANAPKGEQRFEGLVVVNGVALEDYGYYQSVNVASSAISITGSTPASPSTNTTPTISGTGATATTVVTVSEGSTSLCTATASATGAFSCTTSALAAGSHSLTASAPGQGTSAAFTYVVDTALPTIASVDTNGGLWRLNICYNKAMATSGPGDITAYQTTNTTVPTYALTQGYDISTVTTYVASSDSKCVLFILATALTNNVSYTLTVNNVTDQAGNKIAAASTFAFTASDTAAPTVKGITQPGNQEIIVEFSEAITAPATTNFLWDSANWPGSLRQRSTGGDSTGRFVRLTFTGAAPAAAGTHTLDVKNITDNAGNTISPNPTSFTVTIASDTTRPTVVSAVASRDDLGYNTTNVPVNLGYVSRIVITYSEAMKSTADFPSVGGVSNALNDRALINNNYVLTNPDGTAATTGCAAGSGTAITIYNTAGGSLAPSLSDASTARFEQRAVRLTTSALLGSSCNYTLTISNVQDQAGNSLSPNPTQVSISSAADVTAPTVTRASVSATQLTVCFSKSMYSTVGAGAGIYGVTNQSLSTVANFALSNAAGTAQTLTWAGPAGPAPTTANPGLSNDGTCTFFNGAFASGTFNLTVQNVSDPAGNLLSPNPTTLTVGYSDTAAPTLTAVAQVNSFSSFSVTFSKAMTGGQNVANSAGNPNNFSLNSGTYGSVCSNGTATVSSNATGLVWTVTCTATSGYGTLNAGWNTSTSTRTPATTTVSVRNVADTNGNVIAPNPSASAY